MKLSELEAYEIIQEQTLEDISSKGTYLRHKKTGAKVAVVENRDENKVFYIAFRTPVSDSTGVTHIIEHTVLCGSEKYPLKDPFMELVKGSLNTFLNAMTYPDKTVYPIASYNEKDYDNLMDVYLDAVFNPNIAKYQEIFKQEGWHYEMEAPEGDITINGVVYNEMKGVYSNPDSVLERYVSTALFPDTGYANESGGDPEDIPKLKYEDYLAFYRRFYHPSNAYIYLYGDHDIAKRLDYIDRTYLSRYDRIDPGSEIKYQAPFSAPQELSKGYAVSEEEGTEDATYLSYNYAVENTRDTKLMLAMATLEHVLLGMAGAPLKQALLDAGIGSEVASGLDDTVNQPIFHILLKGANLKDKDRFLEIIRQVLEEQAEKGLSKKALVASLNNSEFDYRESDFGTTPKGLVYGLKILTTWLYDEEKVFDELDIGKYFKLLRDEADSGYFEALVKKYLIENPHAALVSIYPEKGFNAKMEQELKERLAAYKQSLSAEEIEGLIADTKALKAYQETQDSPEDQKCLPLLSKSDIERKARPILNEKLSADGVEVIYHGFDTNGILYFEYDFDIEDLTEEELRTFLLLKRFLMGCSTKIHTYHELSIEENLYFGGLEMGALSLAKKNDQEIVRKAYIRYKVLPDNLAPATALLKELLREYDFSDKTRMKQIVSQNVSSRKTSMSSAGHQTAAVRGRSYFSQVGRFEDLMNGVEAFDYLVDVEEHFDERIDKLAAEMEALVKKIYNRENLVVSLTCDEKYRQEALDAIAELAGALEKTGRSAVYRPLALTYQNEGLTDASTVQYVSRSGNFKQHGFSYSGSLLFLRTILSYEYLWNQVRVLGGAYGCMCGFSRNGDTYFVSYRDPNLEKTNDTFEKIVDFVEQFTPEERDMQKFMIGTISNMDIPLSPEAKGDRSFRLYLSDLTEEDINQERAQVLDATAEDIRALAPLVRSVLSDKAICVVGNEDRIRENSGLFDHIRALKTNTGGADV